MMEVLIPAARSTRHTSAVGNFYAAFYNLNRCHYHTHIRSHVQTGSRESRLIRPASISTDRKSNAHNTCNNRPRARFCNARSLRIVPARPASSTSTTTTVGPHLAAASDKATSNLWKHTSNTNIHPDLSTHMRHLMRKIAHPVVVITTADTSASNPTETASTPRPIESTFRGMTVSSFNTVTLDPVPLVSFNVRTPSATHTAMSSSGTFLAHFLLSSPEGARIANAFAKGGNAQGEAFQELVTGDMTGEIDMYAGKGTQGAPLLAGRGVLQVLRCRVLDGKEVVVGDHRVLVAEVLGILAQPGRKDGGGGGGGGGGVGLVYGDQRYRYLGDGIDVDGGRTRDSTEGNDAASVQRTMGLNIRRGDETGS